ncbi:hypothetical protein roselon_00918 [Roseibacterium elongatum DSM 19469]|uniref:Preprotein translocase subunit YajC n=1 Tax=Roseicyclus elongatus DSM 19469 TaxID=1294273 RepID=W8SLA3_9RHOB|nr:hypothetical protein roselon_00918 [Roseibacterium elongatum DSM 19469]
MATQLSGSQQMGVTPLIVLFMLGLILLFFVDAEGRHDTVSQRP